MPKTKRSKGNNKKNKGTKPKRSRAYMYSETIGCLPPRWLDSRYQYTGEEWDVLHADDTPVVYYKDAVLDLNAIEEDLNNRLPNGTEWAVMVHDKEYKHYIETADDDNEISKAILEHIHISIYYPYGKTVSAVRKDLGLYDETKEKFIENFNKIGKADNNNKIKKSLFSYLPHWTESARADKFDYGDYLSNRDKCRANFDLPKFVDSVRINVMSNDFDTETVVNQILNGDLIQYDFHKLENLTDYDKALRYFYAKNKTALDNAFKIRATALSTTKTSGDMVIFYFQGESGAGKTQAAIQFAEKNYKNYCVTGGENDFLQNYMGQECLIIDDARPTTISANEWLKMIDPSGTKASMKSRYFNKTLNVKCIIFTSILPFEEFFIYAKNRGAKIKEPVQQFIRRLTAVVEIASSSKLREVLQGRQTGTRTYHACKDNFRIAKEDRVERYTKNYTKHHDINLDIEEFKSDYDIDDVLKTYDTYSVGRIYSVQKYDKKTEIVIPETEDTKEHKYQVDRKLIERDQFMLVKLNNEHNDEKLDNLIF